MSLSPARDPLDRAWTTKLDSLDAVGLRFAPDIEQADQHCTVTHAFAPGIRHASAA